MTLYALDICTLILNREMFGIVHAHRHAITNSSCFDLTILIRYPLFGIIPFIWELEKKPTTTIFQTLTSDTIKYGVLN